MGLKQTGMDQWLEVDDLPKSQPQPCDEFGRRKENDRLARQESAVGERLPENVQAAAHVLVGQSKNGRELGGLGSNAAVNLYVRQLRVDLVVSHRAPMLDGDAAHVLPERRLITSAAHRSASR
jgi:hypothetical protein